MSHKKGKSQRVKSIKEEEKQSAPNADGVWEHDKVVAEHEKEVAQQEAKKEAPKEIYYSFTKRGDTVNIVMASVFAFFLVVPGISVMFTSGEVTGGLICLAIGIIPLRVIRSQWFSIKTEIRGNKVYHTVRKLFKPAVYWEESIEFYSGILERRDDINTELVLLHSADDNKNVILASLYYKEYDKIDDKNKEITNLLKRTSYATNVQHIQLHLQEGAVEKNFFEVYNESKNKNVGIKDLFLPGKHLKILKDEDEICFSVAFNMGLKIFYGGFIFLGLSFFLLPWAFSAFEIGVLSCTIHLIGVLLFNFGQTEEILKAEGRNLIIGQRWLKRQLIVKNSIPFTEIRSVEVIKNTQQTQNEIYSLKINTANNSYCFGNTEYKEELDWLTAAVTERMMRINSKSTFIVHNDY